jgi:hypothetical protein
MTWSYSGDPASSTLDRTRFLCGDTDTTDQLLSDEELNYLVTIKGSPEGAAPQACLLIMGKMAREVDYWLGPEKVFASKRLAGYKALVETLRAMWLGAVAAPSFDDQSTAKVPKPVFDLGIHDNPGIKGGPGGDPFA